MTGNNHVIVVGVDGSESARQALRWALREAHARGGTVKAVTAWRWDFPQVALGDDLTRERDKARTMLAHEVDSLPSYLLNGVPLAIEVDEGRPADVLVAASRDADLLVLGSHGHSQALHRVLGSVTEDCVRHAACPVVVLPIRYVTQPPAVRRGTSARSAWTGDPVHPRLRQAIL